MKLALAVTTGEAMRTGFVMSLLTYLRANPDVPLMVAQGGPQLYATRNQNARNFLASDCDALLMLDTDMVFDASHVQAIVARAEEGHDVVSGLYYEPNGNPVVGGAGFLLATRYAFETLGEDWFNHLDRPDAPHGEERQWAEDKAFFVRADNAGLKIMVDPDIRIGHLKVKLV